MAGVPGVMPQFGQFGGAFMPGNPMLEGLLASVAAQNPEVVSSAAAAAGIPPPTNIPGIVGAAGMGGGDLGSLLNPMPAGAAAPAIGPWDTTVNPTADLPVPNGMGGNQNLWQGLAGFKAPEAQKPIMNAGVSGAQKAPEISGPAAGMQSNQALWQALQSLMQQRTAPVGPLGQFIGG